MLDHSHFRIKFYKQRDKYLPQKRKGRQEKLAGFVLKQKPLFFTSFALIVYGRVMATAGYAFAVPRFRFRLVRIRIPKKHT
jgi:hypothetical protein